MSIENAMRRIAAQQDAGMGQGRFGIVQSVDAAQHMVRVTIKPEGVVTGWLPVVTMAAGPGWGMNIGLTPGQQVYVASDSGDGQHGVVLGAVHSQASLPPKTYSANAETGDGTPAQPGEVVIRHASGACIRLCADGSIYMQGPVNIRGDLHVQGDVFDKIGRLDGLRQHYNTHTHQAPNGATGAPTPLDP